ncbi:MAG: hypothetical protein PHN38_00280 [Sulfurospirillaceae bacterium]|nr:hypothetical protein [Sulfurospirillaceae bacterium]MDD3462205.1 hypothetical protein [Sulfurospirillaceae bacterium]
MNEMISLSIKLHLVFIGVVFTLVLINIYLLRSNSKFVRVSKKIELIAPQYYLLLFAIFFTGILVLSVRHFALSPSVLAMILSWLVMIFLGIKGHRIYKKIHIKDIQSQEKFKKFALKKYGIDVFLLVFVTIFSYMAG